MKKTIALESLTIGLIFLLVSCTSEEEMILEKFETIRTRYHYFMENRSEVDEILEKGAVKARAVASEVLQRTRSKIGY